MGYFLTAKSRIEQTETEGYWKLVDNELYMNNNGEITLTPRRFWTDNYTIPSFILPFLGDKAKYDVRCAHAHDLFCRFHEKVKINLSLNALKTLGYLHEHKNMIVCENIPKQYLSIIKISKKECDNLFKEMMLSCSINKWICNLFRFAVIFNLNWFRTGIKSLNEFIFYYDDIPLI